MTPVTEQLYFADRDAWRAWLERNHGLITIRQAKESGEWDKATSREMLETPPDLEKALAVNKGAERNFQRLTPSCRKQLIWWVTSAKRKEARERRVNETARLVLWHQC